MGLLKIKWDKVFKSGLSKFFKARLPQNLLSPLLNTLSQIQANSIIKTDISDHYPIFTNLKKYNIMKRDIAWENIQTFKFLLGNIDRTRFLPLNLPSVAYDNFLKIF